MSDSFPTSNIAEFGMFLVVLVLITGSITFGAYLLAQFISYLGVIL